MCTVLHMADTDVYAAPESDEWLSIGEASRLVGLSIETLRRYDDSGRLRASRTPGGQRRYLRSQIDTAFPRPEPAASP